MTCTGRIRYRKPDMALSPPRTTTSQHHGVGKEDLGRPRGLPEQLQGPRPGRHHHPRQPPAGSLHIHDTHVQRTLHRLQHPLPRLNQHLGAPGHQLPPPRRLYPPPPHSPGPDTYIREEEPDGAMSAASGGTSPRRRCSPSAAATTALAGPCTALPNGPNGAGRSLPTIGRGRSPSAPSGGSRPSTAREQPAHAPPPCSSARSWWRPPS